MSKKFNSGELLQLVNCKGDAPYMVFADHRPHVDFSEGDLCMVISSGRDITSMHIVLCNGKLGRMYSWYLKKIDEI
jgi:hypothetical protein